jgi:hypothetical protein
MVTRGNEWRGREVRKDKMDLGGIWMGDVDGREEGRKEDAEGRKTGKHGHTPHLPEYSHIYQNGVGVGVVWIRRLRCTVVEKKREALHT